jgi:hypothetical protein
MLSGLKMSDNNRPCRDSGNGCREWSAKRRKMNVATFVESDDIERLTGQPAEPFEQY